MPRADNYNPKQARMQYCKGVPETKGLVAEPQQQASSRPSVHR